MRIFQRVMQSEIVCETVQKISPRYMTVSKLR
jgi:hypothetical protein